VAELCPELKANGPQIDTRRELWTRENPEGEKDRAAMRDALSVELDRAADALESVQTQKGWLVRGLIAAVVLGLLALVLNSALGPR
jgi:hypothetical protein